MKWHLTGVAATTILLVCYGTAFADDPAAAKEIFKNALEAYKKKDYATACPAFAESYQLDPRPGTLFSMADCEYHWEHIATAAAYYDDFLRIVANTKSEKERLKYLDRTKKAQKKKDELSKIVPELTLVLPPEAPADVRMTRNGEALTAASLGLPLPVDPGEQVITVQLGTGQFNELRITLKQGEKQLVELTLPVVEKPKEPVSLNRMPNDPQDGQTGAGGNDRVGQADLMPQRTDTRDGKATRPDFDAGDVSNSDMRLRLRTAGVVIGCVGVAGVVTGIIAGGSILQRKSFIQTNCPNGECRTVAAYESASALPALNAANALGLGIGGASIVAGGLMIGWGNDWFGRLPKKQGLQVEAVVVGPRDGFVGVKGVF